MRFPSAFLLCALFAIPAHAKQLAYTVRSAEIKQKPFSDAATVATLKENAGVNILSRQGGWMHITSNSGNGWIRMFSLRIDSTGARQGDTMATGVRGLSEEDLKNAHPNPGELEKLKNYAADRTKAEGFARDTKLKTRHFEYLPLD